MKTVQRLAVIIDWNLHGMIACPRVNYLIDIVFFRHVSLSLNNRPSHLMNTFRSQCFSLAQKDKTNRKHVLGIPILPMCTCWKQHVSKCSPQIVSRVHSLLCLNSCFHDHSLTTLDSLCFLIMVTRSSF